MTRSYAQGDIGVGASVYHAQIYRGNAEEHEFAVPSNVGSPGFGLAVSYSERAGKQLNWYLAGMLTRRSFDIRYGYSGLGGGYSTSAHVDLDLFYTTLAPEFRLDKDGDFLLRIGLMAGWKVGGRMTGASNSWSYGSGSTGGGSFVGEPVTDLKGDFRLLFCFGRRILFGNSGGLIVDPYLNTALGSLLKDAQTRGMDFGIVLGWYWKGREHLPAVVPVP